MRVRVFEAETEAVALTHAREYFGSDGVVISSRKQLNDGRVRVVAVLDEQDSFQIGEDRIEYCPEPPAVPGSAVPGSAVPGSAVPEPVLPDLGEPAPALSAESDTQTPRAQTQEAQPDPRSRFDRIWQQIQAVHAFPESLQERILELGRTIARRDPDREKTPEALLQRTLSMIFSFDPIDLAGQNRPVALVGPPGCGKTLTAARLLVRAFLGGRNLRAISTDFSRAGGLEQLSSFADLLGIPLYQVEDAATLREFIGESLLDEVTIVDCMAAHPGMPESMEQLDAMLAVQEMEPILVLSTDLCPRYAARVAMAYRDRGIRRVILTRADLSAGLGEILGALHTSQLRLAGITDCDQVTHGLEGLDARHLAGWLLGDPQVRSVPDPALAEPAPEEQVPRIPQTPQMASVGGEAPPRVLPDTLAPVAAPVAAPALAPAAVAPPPEQEAPPETDLQLVADALRIARLDAAMAERRAAAGRNPAQQPLVRPAHHNSAPPADPAGLDDRISVFPSRIAPGAMPAGPGVARAGRGGPPEQPPAATLGRSAREPQPIRASAGSVSASGALRTPDLPAHNSHVRPLERAQSEGRNSGHEPG